MASYKNNPSTMEKILKNLTVLERAIVMNNYQAQDGFDYWKALTYDKTEDFYAYIQSRLDKGANTIIQLYGIGGTGKSFSMMTIAKRIDPTFSVDHIYFQLADASMALPTIKRKQVVCMDERMPNFGLGSTRLVSEMNHVIETSREAQNSILVASITPYMRELVHWLLETMFIYEDHVYFALRDPKMVVHGYIKIPHPKTVMGEKVMEEYMTKKRNFNAQLRHQQSFDHIADMGKKVMASKKFKDLEEMFEERKKGIPTAMLQEVIAMVFPELRRNVESKQLAVWIRTNRITSGKWKP
jgi:hypothetical protein